MGDGVTTRLVSAFCDRGLVRRNNQDAISIDGIRIQDGSVATHQLDGPDHCLLVADGMGGHQQGQLASSLVIKWLSSDSTIFGGPSYCLEAIRQANRRMYDEMRFSSSFTGMGSTVVGVALRSDETSWFNVGDSRLYLFREMALSQLSTDHVLDASPTHGARKSHVITQSIGGGPMFSEIWPAVGSLKLRATDMLLLCSDGLTDVVADAFVADVFSTFAEPDKITTELAAAISAGGAPDNFSIIVVGQTTKHEDTVL